MKDKMKGKSLLLAAAVLSAVFLTACGQAASSSSVQQDNKGIVKLGTPSATGVMGGVAGLADARGYLEEELSALGYGVEIVGFAGAGPAVNEALIGGSLDFAVLADFPAITARAKGVDTTLIAIENNLSNCALAVSPDSSYAGIEDLVGKKVAIPKGTYMQRFFLLLIQEKGYSEEDFEIVQMTNDMESALVSGAVDGILFTSDTINKYAYVNNTARIIEDTLQYPFYSGQSVLVGRTNYMEEHQEVAEAILRAFIKARTYAIESPQEAADVLADVGSSTARVIEATYGFQNPDAAQRYSFELTEESRTKLENTKQFLLDYGFITDDFNISDWYHGDILNGTVAGAAN